MLHLLVSLTAPPPYPRTGSHGPKATLTYKETLTWKKVIGDPLGNHCKGMGEGSTAASAVAGC